MQKLEHFFGMGRSQKDIVLLVLSGLSLVASMFHLLPLPFDAAWVAIILCGIPIVLEAVIGLVTAFDIKADVLVSLALIASILIGEDSCRRRSGVHHAAGRFAGGSDSGQSPGRNRKACPSDAADRPCPAKRRRMPLPAEQVQVGDLLRVLLGETVPVDGVILSGQTSINQAVMTGESLPWTKAPERRYPAARSINSAFDMRATKVGRGQPIQRMIRLVQSADAGKAKIVGLADRWATWIVVIALTGSGAHLADHGRNHPRCDHPGGVLPPAPWCWLLPPPSWPLSGTPPSTASWRGGRPGTSGFRLPHRLLTRPVRLHRHTSGHSPFEACAPDIPEDSAIRPHRRCRRAFGAPTGKAVVRGYQQKRDSLSRRRSIQMVPGAGGLARAEKPEVLCRQPGTAGRTRYIPGGSRAKGGRSLLNQGCTVIYVAVDGRMAGYLCTSDTLRPESRDMIDRVSLPGHSARPADWRPRKCRPHHRRRASYR